MKLGLSIFRRGFSSSKCKTMAKMAMARIKLLRNKREAVVRQMRRDIALLLQSGQDATARIRVEHVIREQNILAANEFLELFCELIIARLTIISKQRDCPADLKEGISSLIFAAPRCSDIPELLAIRDNFEKKYGKDFVSAATDLRPSCGVNRMLIDKLSVRTPMGEVKLKVMKEIAKEYQIEWDTTESENELLKPPEELINGPCTFVSASSMPVKPKPSQPSDLNKPTARSTGTEESPPMHFKDMESAAEAAAESANKAIAAAQAAAYLANKGPNLVTQSPGFNNNLNRRPNNGDDRQAYRRHSYNAPSAHSNIKFDESDSDEEIETQDTYAGIQPPPGRDPPPYRKS
uniref:IST1-like protein n=1 Tax=Vitis vinifera TaxID=29760 RepID=F6HRY7_VITVI